MMAQDEGYCTRKRWQMSTMIMDDYGDTDRTTGDLMVLVLFDSFCGSRSGSGSNSLEVAIWALSTLRGQESGLAEETPGGFQNLCALFRLGIRF